MADAGGSSPSAPTRGVRRAGGVGSRDGVGRLRRVERRVVMVLALVAAVLMAACAGSSDGDAEADPAAGVDGPVVILRDIAFKPDSLTVPAGSTVTWVFDDRGIPHNVVATDKSFQSDTVDSGRFTYSFERPGTYEYVCTLHPQMTGTIQVT